MTEIWMFTAPYKPGILKDLAQAWRDYDGKKYQIGIEKGRKGYRHIQGRVKISADTSWSRTVLERVGRKKTKRVEKGSHFFDRCARSGIHCTKTEQWSDYEGKEGYYISSDDSDDIRLQRFGRMNYEQEDVLELLRKTNDREVVVWYDRKGNVGKTWLTGHLWEKHKAHHIRLTGTSAESMVKDTASKMDKERRPIVIIDIPRATKWNDQIYEAIEVIKDGLIDDPRYSATAINIKGVKVLVMCNTRPDKKKLSKDRWIDKDKDREEFLKRARRRDKGLRPL